MSSIRLVLSEEFAARLAELLRCGPLELVRDPGDDDRAGVYYLTVRDEDGDDKSQPMVHVCWYMTPGEYAALRTAVAKEASLSPFCRRLLRRMTAL